MAKFDYVLEYNLDKVNIVVDVLSQKAALSVIIITSWNLRDAIKKGMQYDPVAKQQFWVENGLLLTTGWRMYVPKFRDIRGLIIKEGYDTLWAGHPNLN